MKSRKKQRVSLQAGFTLIELLIVVAIIGILAAIAIPNFLQAQTRSKIARAQSDMRTIVTALELYRVDFSAYPPAATYCASMMDSIDAYNHLSAGITTPVAYLSSVPLDIFNRAQAYKYISPGPGWANGDLSILAIWVPKHFPDDTGPMDDKPYFSQQSSPVQWALWSVGPQGALSVFESDSLHVPVPRRYWYDPTNGTISEGILPRLSTGHTAPGGN
jgi:type II secretion system protein G